MEWHNNLIYTGANDRKSTFDVLLPDSSRSFPLLILAHGYKGFKDWGAWNLVGECFARAGFGFVKFNFSHNGGTVDNPIDFPDEKAFAENTYSMELDDISLLLDDLARHPQLANARVDWERTGLIGHSRGGGIAVLAASQDERIEAVATWAAVSDFASRFNTDIEAWKRKGVTYVKNARTGQDLPHNFSFYQDFQDNRSRLDIQRHARQINIPWLILHGNADESVLPNNAEVLENWNPAARIEWIANTGHTFGSKHPWTQSELPAPLVEATAKTTAFFSEAFNMK